VKLGEVLTVLESVNKPIGGITGISEGALSLGGEHIHANNGKIDLSSPKFIPLEFFEQAKRGILQENDILICKDGALTGKIALLGNELVGKNAMINEHLFLVRLDNLITQKYFFNWLYSLKGQELIKLNITGQAQGGLNSTNLKQISIPLPPLEIQQKIVNDIEKIENNGQNAKTEIENLKNEISELVENAGGEEVKLGNVAEIIAGQSPKSNFYNQIEEGLSFYQGKIDFSDIYLKKPRFWTTQITKESFKNDILMSVRAPVGDVNINPFEKICIGRGLCAIRIKDKNTRHYIWTTLKSIKQIIKESAKQGAIFEAITKSQVEEIKISLPSLEIQQKIVSQIQIIETKITELQKIVSDLPTQKELVLKTYL